MSEFSAQKLDGTVRGVASHVTAFAPFSQNSAALRCAGSGHAQLMQSRPCCWLSFVRSVSERPSPISASAGPIACSTPGTPAAHSFGAVTTRSGSGLAGTGLAGRPLRSVTGRVPPEGA